MTKKKKTAVPSLCYGCGGRTLFFGGWGQTTSNTINTVPADGNPVQKLIRFGYPVLHMLSENPTKFEVLRQPNPYGCFGNNGDFHVYKKSVPVGLVVRMEK